MASHFRMFDRPLHTDDVVAGLTVTGDLGPYKVGEAYEERLTINNSVGRCTVQVIESTLPAGATVRVDNITKEVVIKWPAYQVVEDTSSTVPNGDFEAGDDGSWVRGGGSNGQGWSIGTGSDYDTFDGSYSARFADIKTKGSDLLSAILPAKVNDYIRLAGKVQQGASSKGNAGARVSLIYRDEAGNELARQAGNLISSGSNGNWGTSNAEGGAPANTSGVQVVISAYRNKQNKPLWVDSITWNHTYTIGSSEGGNRCVTLTVTDSLNRVAGWSGCAVDEDEPAVTCGIDREFTGGNSFPTEIDVVLGSGLGKVQLDWLTGAAPDKFVVIYDGQEVINTGYRGYREGYQAGLNNILASHNLPPEIITPGDVLTPDSSLPGGYSHSGTDYFQKTSAYPVTAKLLVYGGSTGTQWTCNLSCPELSSALFLSHRLPSSEIGLAYSGKFSGIGGSGQYTNYAVTSGTLPSGMSIDPATGAVSGVPTADGSFSFSVTVTDSAGAAFTATASITVAPRIAIPLTYDESELNPLLTWARLGDSPLATPQGGEFNGYNDRLLGTNLPTWLSQAGAGLTMDLFLTPSRGAMPGTSSYQVAAGIGAATGTAPRIWVGRSRNTGSSGDWIGVGTGTSLTPWKRVGWTSRGQYPELYVNDIVAKPQALMFLDANTVLVTAHYNNTLSRAHRIDLATGKVTGQFDFPAPYVHVASCCTSANGDVWFGEYATGEALRVDLAASFSLGIAQINHAYTMTGIAGAAAIEFGTFGGVEVMLAAEYRTSGTAYLYAIPMTEVMTGGTFEIGEEVVRYTIPLQAQGVRMHAGDLFATYGNSGVATGGVIQYAAFNLTAATGSALVPTLTEYAPSQYPEDLDFHPATGDLWTSTEGYSSTGQTGWTCLWSRKFGSRNHPESRVTATVVQGGTLLAVEIDGHYHGTQAIGATGTAAAVFLGGYPSAAAGAAGFWSGKVRDFVILPDLMSDDSRKAGRRDPRVLTERVLTLANDATTNSVVGWVNEVGVVSPRLTNPDPYIGTGYLYDAANAATRAAQKVAIPSGVSFPNGGYARIRWMQASFTTGGDLSGAGIRTYAGATKTAEALSAQTTYTNTMQWVQRSQGINVANGTTDIEAVVTMTRLAGTASDGYTNAVELVVYSK